jgi:hypothetical protein
MPPKTSTPLQRTPLPRKDTRPTLTIKGEQFTAEFRTLINKAAERSGQTQASWVYEILHREAVRIIKGESDPTAQPPAKDDAALREIEERRLADRRELETKLDALAEQVKALSEMQRQSLWGRLFGRRPG